jgi:hypothetical protein
MSKDGFLLGRMDHNLKNMLLDVIKQQDVVLLIDRFIPKCQCACNRKCGTKYLNGLDVFPNVRRSPVVGCDVMYCDLPRDQQHAACTCCMSKCTATVCQKKGNICSFCVIQCAQCTKNLCYFGRSHKRCCQTEVCFECQAVCGFCGKCNEGCTCEHLGKCSLCKKKFCTQCTHAKEPCLCGKICCEYCTQQCVDCYMTVCVECAKVRACCKPVKTQKLEKLF